MKAVWPKPTGEQGSELIEFAFAATLLFVLIFGIIGFAQAAYTYHFVSNVAREATRYASVRGRACTGLPDCLIDENQIRTYAKNLAPAGINPSLLDVTSQAERSNSGRVTWATAAALCKVGPTIVTRSLKSDPGGF